MKSKTPRRRKTLLLEKCYHMEVDSNFSTDSSDLNKGILYENLFWKTDNNSYIINI
jgi:hypothetical protein